MQKKEDIKLFLSEAEELIQQIEDAILALEEKPKSKKPIQNMFFAFHSLKGLTGLIGLDNLSRFCHQFESFLEKNKESKKTIKRTDEFINFLFEGLDVLKTMTKRIKNNDLSDLDAQFLSEIGTNFEEFDQNYEVSFIRPLEQKELQSISTKKGFNFYKIYIRIEATCVFKKVRLFIIFRSLNKIGRIVTSQPAPELLEKGQYESDFEISFMTKQDKKNILSVLNQILEIENKVITKLSVNDLKTAIKEFDSKAPLPQPQFELEEEVFQEDPITEDEEELGMPSTMEHVIEESETKITGIKVDIEVLEHLMNLFGELVIAKNQVNQILELKHIWDVNRLLDNMDKLFLEIQEIIFQLKLVKVGSIFRRYRRMVRDLSKEHGKDIKFDLLGISVEIDRKVLEELSSPLIHLIRNAVYHGIETPKTRRSKGKDPQGHLQLRTYRQAGSINIEVEDDGKGIDYEAIRQKLVENKLYNPEEVRELTDDTLIQYILMPGFTTLGDADMTSGRGMGLAIVAEKIKELAGTLKVTSKPNRGCKVVLNVPFTRAILNAQMVSIAGDLFAIPLENINQIYTFDRNQLEYIKGDQFYRIKSKLVPVIRMNDYLDLTRSNTDENENENENGNETDRRIAIWCKKDEDSSAILLVDDVLQQLEIVVKPFRSSYSHIRGISGVTITGDGAICLVLDILELLSMKLQETQEILATETV